MKVIKTKYYNKKVLAQRIYNPDIESPDKFNDRNYELFDKDDIALPEMTEEDVGDKIPLADDIEEKAIDIDKVQPIEEDQNDYPKFGNAFDAIRYAIDNKEIIRIHYTCKSGIFIIRDIEPHGWFNARTTGNLIVVSWDRDVNWYRAFIILPNIQKYEWHGDLFEPKFRFVSRKGFPENKIRK